MTANQIAWWNIQESIRSHQQNELNERNKQSITQSLGEEQNRISNQKMKNDFVLGQQGNDISRYQADTAARRAAQDYAIGLSTVANQKVANANQATRNAQDYELGTVANKIKATDVSNNYILGQSGQKIQSLRNAQDYALGLREQDSKARTAEAAMLNASSNFGKLNAGQVVVALAGPGLQQGATAVTKTVAEQGAKVVKKITTQTEAAKPITKDGKPGTVSLSPVEKLVANSPRSTGSVPKTSLAPKKSSKPDKPKTNPTSAYRR